MNLVEQILNSKDIRSTIAKIAESKSRTPKKVVTGTKQRPISAKKVSEASAKRQRVTQMRNRRVNESAYYEDEDEDLKDLEASLDDGGDEAPELPEGDEDYTEPDDLDGDEDLGGDDDLDVNPDADSLITGAETEDLEALEDAADNAEETAMVVCTKCGSFNTIPLYDEETNTQFFHCNDCNGDFVLVDLDAVSEDEPIGEEDELGEDLGGDEDYGDLDEEPITGDEEPIDNPTHESVVKPRSMREAVRKKQGTRKI